VQNSNANNYNSSFMTQQGSQDGNQVDGHSVSEEAQQLHQGNSHLHDGYHQHTHQHTYVPPEGAAHTLSTGFELHQSYLGNKLVQDIVSPPPESLHNANSVSQGVSSVPTPSDLVVHSQHYANPNSPDGSGISIADSGKKRKLTDFQEEKRHKCDTLMAFFRIYMKVDAQSMILKDAIFNLYSKKVPSRWRLARNALYRHMWSSYKDDKISAFQCNYREYIKGLKLVTGPEMLTYEGCEKDIDLLRSTGVNDLWDFREEDLQNPRGSAVESDVIPSPVGMLGLPHGTPTRVSVDGSDRGPLTLDNRGPLTLGLPLTMEDNELPLADDLVHQVDNMQSAVLNILHSLQELKSTIEKKLKRDHGMSNGHSSDSHT